MFELNQIYHMDCMVGMKDIPDKFFDLAIVDPPYGINATTMSMGTNKKRTKNGYPSESNAQRIRKGCLNSGGGKLKGRALNTLDCDWDFMPPAPEYFTELRRVSKNQIIFGGNYFDLPPTRGIFVWDKLQPWENFSQFELGWTSFDIPAKMFRISNTGGRNRKKKTNATEKPIALYRTILATYAQPGDLILDTHVGSGNSLAACYEMGFDFLGFEISKKQYEDAKDYLDVVMSQVRIEEVISEEEQASLF